eukprot:762186-Hanusia_phi.AAC.2
MTFVEELFNFRFDEDKKARLCQAAEREFADVPCGIMDQLISVKGKHGSALFVDCRSLETVAVPLGSGDMKVLVTNSMVKHDLHGSEYPARVRQCKESLEAIKKHFGVEKAFLRDVSKEEVEEAYKAGHMSDLAYKRALHVVTENQRTEEAMNACRNKDWLSLGRLMNESHDSLRDNYQVSCPELDALVDMARSMEGVLGSRMTGAGFGGCIVSLVRESSVEAVKDELTRRYKEEFQRDCIHIVSEAGAGARRVEMSLFYPQQHGHECILQASLLKAQGNKYIAQGETKKALERYNRIPLAIKGLVKKNTSEGGMSALGMPKNKDEEALTDAQREEVTA